MNFVDVAIPTPLRTTFTYINKTSQTLLGKRVLVEFGRRKEVGVVIDEKADHNSKYKLTPLIVETNDIDVTNNEAVIKDGKSIGYVTSGGFAHFINKSIAFSYLDTHQLNSGKGIQVEINGDLFNCSKINEPLYDPSGDKMRI